jgi:hypothetical protein
MAGEHELDEATHARLTSICTEGNVLAEAMHCPGAIGNPFNHLRLRQETGDQD